MALLVIAWSLFALDRIDSSERNIRENLGYAGRTVDIIAIPGEGPIDENKLHDELTRAAVDGGYSIAYTRWYTSGIVAIFDESERFANSHGPLAEIIATKEAGPGVAVAESQQAYADQMTLSLGIEAKPAQFASDIKFQGSYPVVLVDSDMIGFGSGAYSFAGASVDPAQLIADFEGLGLSVLNVQERPGVDPASTIKTALTSVYGMVVALLSVTIIGSALGLLALLSEWNAPKYRLARQFGARKGQLLGIAFWDVYRPAMLGVGVGLIAALLIMVLTSELVPSEQAARLFAVLVATFASTATISVVALAVAARVSRRVCTAVSS